MDANAEALQRARAALLARRTPAGAFVGRLSSSALSTATAAMALAMLDPTDRQAAAGWQWLCEHQNPDGGWGDTVDSPTNISTTTLCWASLGSAPAPGPAIQSSLQAAEAWLNKACGDLEPARLAAAIRGRYGKDQTFSVPILTTCALAGRVGWECVPQLPFELAACPRRLFRVLRLRVVSYALPALIAIGQVRHHHRPTRNPLARLVRALTRQRTLRLLQAIQPATGGYLEAAPLTSFVAMSLAAMGLVEHPVAQAARRFLTATARDDGSWPIDTNLDTWLTTLSVNALAAATDEPAARLSGAELAATTSWLLDQQLAVEHPYTDAAPGGWAWTDLAGGVPDADDTAGAVLALRALRDRWGAEDAGAAMAARLRDAARRGIGWLLDLRNGDGGVPTFCRGWGRLPFDRSGSDLTAHALRAFAAWRDELPPGLQRRIDRATLASVDYLCGEQRSDGAWIPLWFGNQHAATQENPIYGTSRVVRAVAAVRLPGPIDEDWLEAGRRGTGFLLAAQQRHGGFGPVASIEETALAVEALAHWSIATHDLGFGAPAEAVAVRDAVAAGVRWLVEATAAGSRFPAVPIGLYFARLWYSEQLYPLVFTVSALQLASRCLDPRPAAWVW